MDFNDLLLEAKLTYGRYDTKTMHKDRARVYMSKFIAFIQLYIIVKTLVIILVPWNRIEIVLYLVEMYLVNQSV